MPGVLKVRINGAWEEVSAVATEPALDEVWVGSGSPDPAGTAEVWYDTSTLPGTLKIQRENGVWEKVASDGGGSEVHIGTDDPIATDPAAVDELWYTPTQLPPATPPALWDVAVAYLAGDYCFWPDVNAYWRTLEASVGEEPGTALPIDPADEGLTFGGPDQFQIGGFPATPLSPGFDALAGFDVRVDSGGAFGTGDILLVNGVFQVTIAGGLFTVIARDVSGPEASVPLPPARWMRVVVNASGAEFFSSADGVTWASLGAPAAYPLPTYDVGTLYLGNAGGSNSAYGGQLNAVQIYDAAGAAPMQSWVMATQPGPLGAGVSPLTGETYGDPVRCTESVPVAPDNPWQTVPVAPPTTATPGVLRANVNGVWEDVAGGGVAADEVWVGPEDPDIMEPGSGRELWYDTDDQSNSTVVTPLPSGGTIGQPLVKSSDVDGETGWDAATLDISHGINMRGTNSAIVYPGGESRIYERDGYLVLRKGTANTQPKIHNNDASNQTDILTANGFASMTAALKMGTFLGPKIKLYDSSPNEFGLGMESGQLVLYVPDANKISFRSGTTTGEEWAYIDTNVPGGRVLTTNSPVQGGKAKDGVVMAVGDYFKLLNLGGEDQAEFTIGISDGATQQVIHGSVVSTVSATGTARFTVFGEAEFNNPINQLAFAWGDNYGLYIRCGRAGTYQVGWQATHPHNAVAVSLADAQKQSPSLTYGTVTV